MHQSQAQAIDKEWGAIVPLWNNGTAYLDELRINKGGKSSKHRHAKLFNVFRVKTGKIRLMIWDGDTRSGPRKILLMPHVEAVTVPPGIFHRFVAIEDSVVYEVCRVSSGVADREDIERVVR